MYPKVEICHSCDSETNKKYNYKKRDYNSANHIYFNILENNEEGHLIRMILKILEEILVTYPNKVQTQHKAYIRPEKYN